MIETETDAAVRILRQAFFGMREIEKNKAVFSEDQHSVSDVLRFVADHRISLLKIERLEPTLEELFMEVTEK